MPLVDDLRGVLGPDRVKDSPLDLRLYNRDAGVTPDRVRLSIGLENAGKKPHRQNGGIRTEYPGTTYQP